MLKLLLKKEISRFLFSNFRGLKGEKKKRMGVGAKILIGILVLYVAVVFVGMMTMLALALCKPLHTAGLSWLYFSIMSIMAFSLSFIFGVFSVAYQLYDAKDNELLLSMPILPRTILGSRIVFILIEELLIQLIVFAPSIAVYSIVVGMGALQYVFALLCVVAMTLFSTSICAVIGWLVHLISSRMKNKSYVSLVFYVVFLAGYFLIYSKFQEYLQLILLNGGAVAGAIKTYFYLFYAFGDALANGGIVSGLLFVAISTALFALVYLVISKCFIKIATSKRGSAKAKYVRTSHKSEGVSGALTRKELKRFFSSAGYMMNSGVGLVLMIIASVFLAVRSGDYHAMVGQDSGMRTLFSGILAIAPIFFLSTTMITAPSISLEGKGFWILRSSPISPRDVIAAKIRAALILTLPPLNISIAVMSIAIIRDIPLTVLCLITSNAFAVFSSCFGLMINLIKYRFDWDNETLVIKQGASATITMLSQMGIMIGFFAVDVLLSVFAGPIAALSVCAAISTGLAIMMAYILKTRGTKRFEAINA